MANRIPRAATRLRVTWLVGSNATPAGTTVEVYKDEFGWHEKIGDTIYSVFVGHLRNENLCRIEAI